MFQPLQRAGLRTWTFWRMRDDERFPFGCGQGDCPIGRGAPRRSASITLGMIPRMGGSRSKDGADTLGGATRLPELRGRLMPEWLSGRRSRSAGTAAADKVSTAEALEAAGMRRKLSHLPRGGEPRAGQVGNPPRRFPRGAREWQLMIPRRGAIASQTDTLIESIASAGQGTCLVGLRPSRPNGGHRQPRHGQAARTAGLAMKAGTISHAGSTARLKRSIISLRTGTSIGAATARSKMHGHGPSARAVPSTCLFHPSTKAPLRGPRLSSFPIGLAV